MSGKMKGFTHLFDTSELTKCFEICSSEKLLHRHCKLPEWPLEGTLLHLKVVRSLNAAGRSISKIISVLGGKKSHLPLDQSFMSHMCKSLLVLLNCTFCASPPCQTRHQHSDHAEHYASCVGEDELQLAGPRTLPLDPCRSSHLP